MHAEVTHFNDLNTTDSANALQLYATLKERHIEFASGVPCGVLRHLIAMFAQDEDVMHVPATRESEAIGIAFGAYLSGKHACVYMQNSGLFAASNDVASLLIPYMAPILLIVSLRGTMGEDAVQHKVTGRATLPLLSAIDVPYLVYWKGCEEAIHELIDEMHRTGRPGALLLRRGWHT